MKKSLIYILSIIFSIMLCSQVKARVSGVCSNCHTMHNSQGGAPMAFQINAGHTGYLSAESLNPQLLLTGCVGCHTALGGSTWKDSVTGAPIVYNTGAPTSCLAGGNFYWVANGADAKGHNVSGIASEDAAITAAEGAPGGSGCGGGSCHDTLALGTTTGLLVAPGGCQGCHLNVMHHANDGTGTKYVDSAVKGWYRFLSGHMTASNGGVKGIEDRDWGYNDSSSNHNEYLGVAVDKTGSTSLTNGSMTAFCCGCHGDFHTEQDSSGSWIRHPSDTVIPNSGEYSNAFGADGSGYGTYNPDIPVARPSLQTTDPNLVYIGTDMVMCLSCHRPHGSQYYKMLRWEYDSTSLSTALKGCNVCHTSKN